MRTIKFKEVPFSTGIISYDSWAGHILRKVYNCTERTNISDLQNVRISCQENFSFRKNFRRPFLVIFPFHPPKNLTTFYFSYSPKQLEFFPISSTKKSDDLFLVISFVSYVFQPKRSRYNCTTYFFHHSFSTFHTFHHFFYAFPLFLFKMYNYN